MSKPTYHLFLDAWSRSETIRRIRCKVYLDRIAASRSRVVLFPSSQVGERMLNGGPWSLYGEIPNFGPGRRTYVHVPQFKVIRVNTTKWGPDLDETYIRGSASAIIVSTCLARAPRPTARVVAALHGGSLVAPRGAHERSFTGAERFRRAWRCRARIEPHTLVIFDQHTLYSESSQPARVNQCVLQVDITAPLSGPQIDLRRYAPQLDNLLTLASLAGRERTSWHQLTASDGQRFIEYFDTQRRPPRARTHSLGPLIPKQSVGSFLAASFRTLQGSVAREEIIAASWVLAPYRQMNLESEYLAGFASLEALTLRLSDSTLTGQIVDQARWSVLSEAIKQLLRDWTDGTAGLAPEERVEMYAKLRELNRRPFASAWNHVCTSMQLSCDDLWPVVDKDRTSDLFFLRNRLAHGRPTPQAAGPLLAQALLHLRWTLERLVLRALGQDFANTDAGPSQLRSRGIATSDRLARDRRSVTSELAP